MALQRQVVFWLAALAVFVLLLWLLSGILLPFVAGLAIAYLLTPLTDRLERLGVNRLVAALLIITVVVLAFVYRDPAGGADPRRPADVVHRQHSRLRHASCRALLSDPSRPWVQKVLGAASTPTSASAIW